VAAADVFSSTAISGLVSLTGTTSQTLGGTSATAFSFPDLTINNPAGIVISHNAIINGNMTFTAGLVDIANNNLTFGQSAGVSGAPSSAAMIIATGTGQVLKNWTGTGSFTYPVGDNNLIPKYSPVTLSFTSGTFGAGASAGLNLANAKFNDPSITGAYLNRYWNISQTGIAGFTANALCQYLASDVVGTESSIYCLRTLPAPISTFGLANTGLHQLTASGLTSLGTLTGGPGYKILNLTSVLIEGLYNSLGTMNQARDGSGAHWPTGIADHINVELHNSATYASIAYSANDIPLSTTGSASFNVPIGFNSSYYITVKHRNSVETTTATAISFSGNTINQSFGALAGVFGSNLKFSTDGYYLLYGGDVNQDGVVDIRDYIPVDNDSYNFASGYLVTDVNGDGVIDIRDFIIIDNNNFNFIGTIHP
jgi:hypothetical protein